MSGPEKFHSVFARNCEIRRIDRELAASFLNACHLYGDCAAAYRYGLFVSRSPGVAKVAAEGSAVGCVEGCADGCSEGCVAEGGAMGAAVDSAEGCAVGAAEGRQTYPVGTLVAVASFSKARRWSKKGENGEQETICSYEWLRYASLPELRVLGGMGRILARFIEDFHPDDIMSYVPLRHFSGEVYESLGFVCEGVKIFPNGERSRKYRLKLKAYR
ncbi:MAG: hypothetical protein SO413_06325 [Candidatus Cryptobacteroides sp.]|nr:hypothetical protein [Candidatus Cryptobacteroides sp.]